MTAPRVLVPPPGPGVYTGVDANLYHAWDACSSSRLRQLRRSPLHLKHYLDAPQKDSPALKIGRATHARALEPHMFDAHYTTAQPCTATTAKKEPCKNDGVKFHLDAGWLCGVHMRGMPGSYDDSREVLAPDEMATATRIGDALRNHPTAGGLLTAAEDFELTVVWQDADTGVMCKARYDLYAPSVLDGVIGDLKTTQDAGARSFERTIFNDGLDIQGTFYLMGAEAAGLAAKHYCLIAAEKEAPAVTVYRLLDTVIETGRERVRSLLRQYAECQRTGIYPGYSNDVVDVGLPAWSWDQIDNELHRYAENAA